MSATHSKSTERPAATANGLVMLLVGLLLMVGGPVLIALGPDEALRVVGGLVAAFVGLLLLCGLYSLQPNEAMAILLFGDYRPTAGPACAGSCPGTAARRSACGSAT